MQVLIYPGLDRDMTVPSLSEFADAPILSRDDVLFLHEVADAGHLDPQHPYRVPAAVQDLSGLPAAIVVTGECDPIRDWGERYAGRLREARVQTTLTRYPGSYHGFVMQSDYLARGQARGRRDRRAPARQVRPPPSLLTYLPLSTGGCSTDARSTR